MADSNADKYFKIGQLLGAKTKELEKLQSLVDKGSESAETVAAQMAAKRKELAAAAQKLNYLKSLKGSDLGTVVKTAEEIAAKKAPSILGKGALYGTKIGAKMAAGIAGPIGLALSTAQDAAASEDLGPQEGAARRMEMGERLTPEEEKSLKFSNGGGAEMLPDYGYADGGSPEQQLGASVTDSLEDKKSKNKISSIEEEMESIRAKHPEFENVSDAVLSKSILENRKNKKADGGFLYDVDPGQLGVGLRTEFEHTDDANEALKIAMDHLAEDSKYYQKLEKMEGKKLNCGGKVKAADGYAPGKGKKSLQDAIDKMDEEDLQEAMYQRSLKINAQPQEESIDADVDWSSYKKGDGKKTLKENEKLKVGGLVAGQEDEYAGDPIPAQLNKNELVLNVEQQQRLVDLLNNRKTKLPTNDRVDNLLNKKELSLNQQEQEKLFSYIKGENPKKPTGHIISKHFAEGGVENIVDETMAQDPQQIPMAPNADYPIAPQNAAPAVGLPESMKYQGPASNIQGTLPAQEELAAVNQPVDMSQIQAPTSPATIKQLQQAAEDEQLAIANANVASAQKNEIEQQHALQQTANAKQVADEDISAEIYDRLKKQDLDIKKEAETSGMDKFFSKQGTLGKIFFGAALAIGTLASFKTGSNPVLNYISKTIDDDLEAKKLSRDQALAMKNAYLDFQKVAIDKQMANTNNLEAKSRGKLVIAQINKIQSEITMDRAKIAMAQRQQQQLQELTGKASKDGIPVEALQMLPQEMQSKAIVTKNGKVKFAIDKERAQKVTEYQNSVVPAIDGAKRILDMSQDFNKVTDLTTRAKIASEMKALGGQLRVPFTGPGILTDKEFDRLMDVIGDPNKLFALPSLQKAKLETVISKLQKDLKVHYSNAGINVEDSANEKNVQTLMKNNKNMSEYDAERALKKSGYWTKE
jgi:hypothetical protein